MRQSAECAPTPEESDIVLRNHVTFTAKTPELRAWTGVMVLQSLEKFLLHRHYAEIFRITPVVEDSNDANLLVSWGEGVFHKVTVHSLSGEEQQWLVLVLVQVLIHNYQICTRTSPLLLG